MAWDPVSHTFGHKGGGIVSPFPSINYDVKLNWFGSGPLSADIQGLRSWCTNSFEAVCILVTWVIPEKWRFIVMFLKTIIVYHIVGLIVTISASHSPLIDMQPGDMGERCPASNISIYMYMFGVPPICSVASKTVVCRLLHMLEYHH